MYTHVGLGIAQHQARGLGHHQGVDVAHAALLQVQLLGAEGDVGVLLDILGVDDDAAVAHAHLVKHLAQQQIQTAELAAQLGEVDAPFAHVLAGADDARVVQLADFADETAAANQDLALAAGIAREGLAHHVHDVARGEFGGRFHKEVLAGLVPDAAGEVDVLLLDGIPDLACHTKQERLLHAHAHVIDGCLFLVAHRPAHLLVGKALQRGLLDLHLEYLAQVTALLGQRLELRRLHVEFAGGTAHAHQVCSRHDIGETVGDTVDGAAVHCHHRHAVGIASQDIEHQVLVTLGDAVALVTAGLLHQDGIGGVKDVVVGRLDGDDGRVVSRMWRRLHNVIVQVTLGLLGVHTVIIDGHAARVLAARIARNLVNRGGHRADFHDLLVNLVEQQVGRPLVAQVG